jgi:hypothetical protein
VGTREVGRREVGTGWSATHAGEEVGRLIGNLVLEELVMERGGMARGGTGKEGEEQEKEANESASAPASPPASTVYSWRLGADHQRLGKGSPLLGINPHARRRFTAGHKEGSIGDGLFRWRTAESADRADVAGGGTDVAGGGTDVAGGGTDMAGGGGAFGGHHAQGWASRRNLGSGNSVTNSDLFAKAWRKDGNREEGGNLR